MAMIKVRATARGFNGGVNPKLRGVWGCARKDTWVPDEDRGLKNVGDVFMIEESRFTDVWMERVDPPAKVEEAAPTPVSAEAPKRGRPKKVV